MALLAMVFSGALLVFGIVILAQRLGRGSHERRVAAAGDGGGDLGWLPAATADSGSDCSGGDGGAGCDGGGGGGD